jgi:hypothetical protein
MEWSGVLGFLRVVGNAASGPLQAKTVARAADRSAS